MKAELDPESIQWIAVSLNDLIWICVHDSLYNHLRSEGLEPTYPNSRSFVMPIWRAFDLLSGRDDYDCRARVQLYGPHTLEMDEL